MSTNHEQFATASSQLERHGDHIRIDMNHKRGWYPCIGIWRKKYNQDWNLEGTVVLGKADIANCRKFARKFAKCININAINATIDTIEFLREEDFWGMTPEVARYIQAIFEEIKTNRSILSLKSQFEFFTAIPALDLRYFFQNNESLKEFSLLTETSYGPVSRAQVTHISTALRDLSLKTICINCSGFRNNGALEQILSACQKMEGLCTTNEKHSKKVEELIL